MYNKLVPPEELTREGQFSVLLSSVGNPDHGEDPNRRVPGVPRRTAAVKTLAEASTVCTQYITEFTLGGGNWAGGQIHSGGSQVAQVSYNGRVWQQE